MKVFLESLKEKKSKKGNAPAAEAAEEKKDAAPATEAEAKEKPEKEKKNMKVPAFGKKDKGADAKEPVVDKPAEEKPKKEKSKFSLKKDKPKRESVMGAGKVAALKKEKPAKDALGGKPAKSARAGKAKTSGKGLASKPLGVGLMVVAFALAMWNEMGPAHRYAVYMDGLGRVIEISPNRPDPENQGELVHFSGLASTPETLRDKQTGMEANAVKFQRKVEMYQWLEVHENVTLKNPDGTISPKEVYNYNKGWSEKLHPTLAFKKPLDHVNPERMLFQSMSMMAQNVSVGGFSLDGRLVENIEPPYEQLVVTTQDIERFPPEWQKMLKVIDGDLYFGFGSPDAPQIGDHRIRFEKVATPQLVTVIGKQQGGRVAPFNTEYNGIIYFLKIGNATPGRFIIAPKADDLAMEWALRIVAAVMMFFGMLMFANANASWPVRAERFFASFMVAGGMVAFGMAWSDEVNFVYLLLLLLTGVVVALLFGEKKPKTAKKPVRKSKEKLGEKAVALETGKIAEEAKKELVKSALATMDSPSVPEKKLDQKETMEHAADAVELPEDLSSAPKSMDEGMLMAGSGKIDNDVPGVEDKLEVPPAPPPASDTTPETVPTQPEAALDPGVQEEGTAELPPVPEGQMAGEDPVANQAPTAPELPDWEEYDGDAPDEVQGGQSGTPTLAVPEAEASVPGQLSSPIAEEPPVPESIAEQSAVPEPGAEPLPAAPETLAPGAEAPTSEIPDRVAISEQPPVAPQPVPDEPPASMNEPPEPPAPPAPASETPPVPPAPEAPPSPAPAEAPKTPPVSEQSLGDNIEFATDMNEGEDEK